MEFAETNRDKVGVLTQYGTTTVLEVHDPIFLEKLSKFMPDQVDRFNPTWGLGKHTLGMITMFDE